MAASPIRPVAINSIVAVSGMGAAVAPLVAVETLDDTEATPGPESEFNADMASSALDDIPPNNRKTIKNVTIECGMLSVSSLP